MAHLEGLTIPWRSLRDRHNLRIGLAGLFLVSAMLGAAVPAWSQEPEAVFGTLRFEDEPVAGVTIRVETPDETEVGEETTADDGTWRIDLPEPGPYVVVIDPETLPEDIELRDPDRAALEVNIRTGQERQVLFLLGEGVGRASPWGAFAQRSLLGIKFGLLIGMMSVGLSLIFGTTRLINFAHGELVTIGAVLAWILNFTVGLHLFIAGAISIVAVALFSGGLERFGFRNLRHRKIGGFQFLIITIGLSLILQHVLVLIVGSEFRQYAQYARVVQRSYGPFAISSRDAILMVLSVLILVGVAMFLLRTRMGKALRAVSDNPNLAEASGIDVDRVIAVVWLMGGALAAIGGIFLGLYSNVQYLMGFRFLLLMFAGVILGGLGTAFGAMLGGLLVGYVSEISTLVMRPEMKTVWALVVLILVLLVRPQGILGQRERIG